MSKLLDYITEYGGCNTCNMEALLAYGRKPTLKKLLGDQTTYSFDVVVKKDYDTLLDDLYRIPSVADILYQLRKKFDFPGWLDDRCILDNQWTGWPFDLVDPKTGEFYCKVTKGMKVMKILSKLPEEVISKEGYEALRLAQSQVRNDALIKDTVILSIEPMDYFTMSDNSNGWSSCMSWVHEGCFRRGTLEMYSSPYVIVAYIASKTETFYGEPSKKWRELFIVHGDVIAGIKGYPYWNRELEKVVLKELKELATKNLGWTQYLDKEVAEYTCSSDEGNIYDINGKYVGNFYTYTMYNDFQYDHNLIVAEKRFDVEYSGPSFCLCCGERTTFGDFEYGDGDSQSNLVCKKCSSYAICSCCDCAIRDEEEVHYVQGKTLCDYCFITKTATNEDGERVFISDSYTIVFATPTKNNNFYDYKEKSTAVITDYDTYLSLREKHKDKIQQIPSWQIFVNNNVWYWNSKEMTIVLENEEE